MAAPFPTEPWRRVAGPAGVPIAVFRLGAGAPVVLVHGTTSDHTTWRVVAPMLATRFELFAVDRRGRGASGDGPASIADGYRIEDEYDDLAAVVETVADETGAPVDVVGHSFGGRCGLGAAERTTALRRLVVYEGAPAPRGERFERADLVAELEHRVRDGDREGALEQFMRVVVGMDDAAIAAFRADAVWPARVSAAHTIPRELAAAGVDVPARFAGVRQPTLLLVGGESRPVFRAGSGELASRLARGRLAVIDGARHGAHHTHAAAFVDAVADFLAPRPG
ncbi:MAG TPA: alpha/beta fold hydrolase [Candidatus Limnocylindrales bacterium]|nr:alpha/beta fold hydrolase [Candidatus Limnocylindrales bacterium]